MTLPIVQVDAFTSQPFLGNPAAVCVLPEDRDPSWMQKVAREMNLSETVFLRERPDGFGLRWFTPAVEVELCGHATLAAAHVLWETGRLEPGATARFHTRSGLLTAVRRGDWSELDFPATPNDPAEAPRDAVRNLRPDFTRLGAVEARGIIVTSRSATPDRDFVSRFFAPASGVNEDPVTGSAHCALAPFWSQRLKKNNFVAHQISQRGGVLRIQLDGRRVRLRGQALT